MNGATAAGGVLLAAVLLSVAIALHHRKKALRVVCVLVLAASFALASQIQGFLAGITTTTVLGIGIALPLAVYLAVIFCHDVFAKSKGGQPRRWQTPIIAAVLPALLLSLSGIIPDLINAAAGKATSTSDSIVTKLINDKGKGGK